MTSERRFRLELLNEYHNIEQFSCGDEDIDDYLREDALLDMVRNVTRTFVEIDTKQPAPHNVAGYFTLCADALSIDENYFDDWQPADDSGAAYPAPIKVPLVELIWLARDLRWRKMGLGDILMVDALEKVATSAECIGVMGLHLRSSNQGVRLYTRYDFQRFREHPHYDEFRYVLPIKKFWAIVHNVQELLTDNTAL